jgi:oligoribonuclease NrnB/cAMP/cGMP phosphodiesterase (DHH superfamily)
MKPLCIYHSNCADGFGAAWVFHRRFADGIEFHPGIYQQPPPPVAGRSIFLVDFSYKSNIVKDILTTADSVTLIDHHKTALEDLNGVLGQEHCSLEKSGAILAWEFCYPGQEPPQLLLHIQDRDLWQFKLPQTREIQAAVFSYPYDFDVWDRLMAMPLEELALQGEAIERKHFKDIEELLGVTQRRMVIGGHNVPVANLPYIFVSDAAHKMALDEAFAACYWDTPKGSTFGLRSTDEGIDVSNIAKLYGGGGHIHASGFTVPYVKAAEFEV